MNFDYDGWISNHTNDEHYLRAYNGSIFALRGHYNNVFHEEDLFGPVDDDKESSKIYKINFHVNILPSLCSHYTLHYKTGEEIFHDRSEDREFLPMCSEQEDNTIYASSSIDELLDFKWDSHSGIYMKTGFFFHCVYLIAFNLYVNEIYIEGNIDNIKEWQLILILAMIYPFCYDHMQLINEGPVSYFSEKWNYNDMAFIWTVIATLFIQRFEMVTPQHLSCKLLLVVTASSSIVKTFFFMRIFKDLSYLVTMIFQVFIDLMPFLLFYLILIVFFSLYFGILGLGNFNVGTVYRDTVIEAWKADLDNAGKVFDPNYHFPNPETYQKYPDAA